MDRAQSALPSEMLYGELENQWRGMLHKFAGWNIGMEHEDLYQEMSIVLFEAQQRYDPLKGAAFSTYLFRALLNKIRKLRVFVNDVKKRIPPHALVSFDLVTGSQIGEKSHDGLAYKIQPGGGETPAEHHYEPEIFDDVDAFELLTGAPTEVQRLANLILGTGAKRSEWANHLPTDEVTAGVKGLKRLLRPKA